MEGKGKYNTKILHWFGFDEWFLDYIWVESNTTNEVEIEWMICWKQMIQALGVNMENLLG